MAVLTNLPHQQHDGQRRRHGGEGEDEPHLPRRQQQDPAREQRAQDRAGVVRGPVEPERGAAPVRLDGLGEQCVSRRGAEPLADPVREADRQHVPRRRRQRDQWPDRARSAVAQADQRLPAAHPVREPSAGPLHQARCALRDALDEAEERRPRPERLDEEDGEQREDHVAGRIVEQRHDPQPQDVPAEEGPEPHHGETRGPCSPAGRSERPSASPPAVAPAVPLPGWRGGSAEAPRAEDARGRVAPAPTGTCIPSTAARARRVGAGH